MQQRLRDLPSRVGVYFLLAMCLFPEVHVANNGHGPIAWVTAYEEAYGPLPEIWFTDAHGTVDQAAIARYQETGTVVAEWDCGPAGGDGDIVPDQPETARR